MTHVPPFRLDADGPDTVLQQTISPPKKTPGTNLDRKQRQFTPAPQPPAGSPSTAIRSPFRTAAGCLQTSGGMRTEHIFDRKTAFATSLPARTPVHLLEFRVRGWYRCSWRFDSGTLRKSRTSAAFPVRRMTGSCPAWRCDRVRRRQDHDWHSAQRIASNPGFSRANSQSSYGRVTASRCDAASELINAARLEAGAVAESVAAVGDDVPEEVDDTDRGNGGSS